MKFWDLVDHVIVIDGEMIEGKGEDSYVCCVNDNAFLAGVCDGCGGLGSKKYSIYGEHTGAYIGSRTVSGVLYDWFNTDIKSIPVEKWNTDICEKIKKAMALYAYGDKASGKASLMLKGSMTKEFPTTAVFAVCTNIDNAFAGKIFWAGDSRGYILTKRGLRLVTQDDVAGEDAMSNLKNDGVLNNVISASDSFEMHDVDFVVKEPMTVICATDGCFNYLPSPMHFEYIILQTLMNAQNPEEWETTLKANIRKVSGDDHTMTMACMGYGNFVKMKNYYADRVDYLRRAYIENWSALDEQQQLDCWNRYQKEMM